MWNDLFKHYLYALLEPTKDLKLKKLWDKMVITYNPGPLWSSPGLMLKRFYCRGWDQGCLEGGCRRSWAKWRRLKGTCEVVMQKFLSLRVEAFHNSIALTDHVVVSVAIIGRRNNFNKFSGWPGPGWSSPGISISLKHLDRHIFL